MPPSPSRRPLRRWYEGPAEAEAKLIQTDTQVLPAMLCRPCERYNVLSTMFYTQSHPRAGSIRILR